MALALPDMERGASDAVLCGEFSSSCPLSSFSLAAEKLSFALCGRAGICPDGSLGNIEGNTAFPHTAAEASCLPLMALSNADSGFFSGRLAHSVLYESKQWKKLAHEAVSAAEGLGFSGLYVEFCSLFPFDRERFLCFMQYFSALAHERGLFFLSALECEGLEEESFPLFCETLCNICDFPVLLTIDYNLQLPAASSPLYRIRQDITRLKNSCVPGKYLLAFSDRALDYSYADKKVSALSSARALNLAVSAAKSINYDFKSACAFFNYRSPGGQAHRVFTPDVRSAAALKALADSSAVSGIFFRRSERIPGPEFNFICSSYCAKKYL